ncbi:hypothetical protein PTT_19000 [Pyrenophora teres f. teres 0-1]|uniref:Ankyrin n=1 Tax=Pyrenophora teres f. teres (strain 0-1) TaxID=861557 RepID=E3S7Z1_PYRTT|nr:hypothetical protein PTT_19000 [Pyrenophora teres f. teres 0-1]
MFLLMNNFAGSDYAAFDIIFEEVKRFSVFQMENILNAIPDPYTSAIQQSILTIAIKSNVPPIVEILLRRGLDANRVTCRFGGKLFTPLDLACIFDRLEVVKILICHGANPNRKIHPDGGAAHHLLNLNPSAIEYPPNTCAILQCLLMAHARIYCQLLRSRQFWTSGLLVDVYIRYSKYPIEFTNYNELKDPFFIALTFCSSERSTAAIKTMIGSGGDTTHPKYPFYNRTLGNILRFVSYQGNSYLVDYILDSGIARDSGCRCEAVRGNNVGLVQKYVRAGVDIHGTHFAQSNRPPNPGALPQDIEPQLLKGSFLKYKTTTPFAEAIRWRRQHLSEEFQNLNHLGDTAIGPLLLAAIEIGDKKIVQRLLDLDHEDYRYTFALPYYISAAVLGNHEEIVENLLQAGFPPSSHCVLSAIFVRNARLIDLFLDSQFLINRSEMAVYFAVRWGNLGVLKKLIAVGFPVKGIQVNRDSSLFLVSYTADTRLSPLGEAIKQDNIPILRLLLENGAAIDSPIPTGTESPLIIAISSGNEQMVGELLARGVDPNDPGALKAAVVQSMEMVKIILTAFLRRYPTGDKGFFDSTLRKAIREKKEKIIWMLVKHADLNNAGWMKEIRAGEQQYRQYVIPWGTEYLPTLLGEGIATRSVNIVRMLLDSGGDPNSTVEIISKSPPGGRLIAISKAISTGDLDMLKLLHRTGADLHFNATLRIARTSLQLATELGHSDIVQYLLDHSVDVNASPCNFAGGTALQFAAKAGSVGTAELLLQHGADINAPGSRYGGKTAFEFAAEFGRMDMLLLLFHRCVDLVSDGGAQIRRACRFAEENGQVVSKSLVMQLAEAKGMNVFPRGGYSNVGVVGLPVRGGSNLSFGG